MGKEGSKGNEDACGRWWVGLGLADKEGKWGKEKPKGRGKI